jgi:hypothetical protein
MKNTTELGKEIERIFDSAPEDVPVGSRFLLEIGIGDLAKTHIKTQAYWVKAIAAARRAKAKEQATATQGTRDKDRREQQENCK